MFYNDDDGDRFKALDGLVLFWFKDMFLPTWVFFFFFARFAWDKQCKVDLEGQKETIQHSF